MKKIVKSLGMAALGAACVQQSSNAQALGGDGSKPWSVSVALRGFYDDNVRSVNSSLGKVDTFGFAVEPSLGFVLPLDQTTLSLAYTYSYKYYDKRPEATGSHDDQTHTIAARMLHNFSERTSLSVGDSFVIGQEPDVLRSGSFTSPYQSISGNNIRNYGYITLNHQFAPKFGVEVGYANSLFDYDDDLEALTAAIAPSPVVITSGGYPVGLNGISRSAALDRIEHAAHVDARWNLQSTTVALVGYQFALANYTADEPIGVVDPGPPSSYPTNNVLLLSDARNSQSHYAYVGAEHSFRPDLTGNARVGVRFTDYVNSPDDESALSPYVSASLRYNYAQDCDLQIGLSHDRNASDAFSVMGSSITTDVESTVVYGSITHKIIQDLFGTAMVQYQNSEFNGGVYNSTSEDYFLASLSLEYRINRHVTATLSYHYDQLDSSLPFRSFDRNRVFVGAMLSY